MSSDPRPLREGLDRVLRGLRAAESRPTGGVFGRWAEAVGPLVAEHVQPVRLRDGRLLVEVDDPAWATQLQFLDADLRQRLRTIAGVEIDALDVRVRKR